MSNQGTAKTKKGKLSKKRIFDAALNLIKTKGYEQTTIVDILEAAKISNGTFYHYFNSKQDILIDYVKEESADITNYYDSLQKQSYTDTLLKVIKYQASYFLVKGHEFVSNFYSIMLVSKNDFFDIKTYPLKGILFDCIENGQKSGEFTDAFTAEYISELALSLLYMITTSWCLDEGNFDLHEEIRNKFLTFLKVFEI